MFVLLYLHAYFCFWFALFCKVRVFVFVCVVDTKQTKYRYMCDAKVLPSLGGAFGPGALWFVWHTCIRVMHDEEDDVFFSYEFWHGAHKQVKKGNKVIRREMGCNYVLVFELESVTPRQLREGYVQKVPRILVCTTQDIVDLQRARVKKEEEYHLQQNEMETFETEEARLQFRKDVCRDKLETPFYADYNAPDFFDKPNGTCPMHAQLRILDKHTSAVPNYIHIGDVKLYPEPEDTPTYGQYLEDPNIVIDYEMEEKEIVSKNDGLQLYSRLMRSYTGLAYMKKQVDSAISCGNWPCVITGVFIFCFYRLYPKACLHMFIYTTNRDFGYNR